MRGRGKARENGIHSLLLNLYLLKKEKKAIHTHTHAHKLAHWEKWRENWKSLHALWDFTWSSFRWWWLMMMMVVLVVVVAECAPFSNSIFIAINFGLTNIHTTHIHSYSLNSAFTLAKCLFWKRTHFFFPFFFHLLFEITYYLSLKSFFVPFPSNFSVSLNWNSLHFFWSYSLSFHKRTFGLPGPLRLERIHKTLCSPFVLCFFPPLLLFSVYVCILFIFAAASQCLFCVSYCIFAQSEPKIKEK